MRGFAAQLHLSFDATSRHLRRAVRSAGRSVCRAGERAAGAV